MNRAIKPIAIAAVLTAIVIPMIYLSAWTPAEAVSGPDGCSARSNPYVGEPTVFQQWPRHP